MFAGRPYVIPRDDVVRSGDDITWGKAGDTTLINFMFLSFVRNDLGCDKSRRGGGGEETLQVVAPDSSTILADKSCLSKRILVLRLGFYIIVYYFCMLTKKETKRSNLTSVKAVLQNVETYTTLSIS